MVDPSLLKVGGQRVVPPMHHGPIAPSPVGLGSGKEQPHDFQLVGKRLVFEAFSELRARMGFLPFNAFTVMFDQGADGQLLLVRFLVVGMAFIVYWYSPRQRRMV